jgi:V/A-type H+-transporting ATPase subunit I
MPVNKVKKINLLIHKSEYDEVINSIQESGIIHIDEQILEKAEKEINIEKTEIKLTDEEKLKNYILIIDKLLERIKSISVEFESKEKQSLLNDFCYKIETFTKAEYNRLINSFNYEKILSEINELLEKEKSYLSEIEKDKARINALQPISNLTIPLEYLKDSENCFIRLFVISRLQYQQFLEELETSSEKNIYQFYFISEYENNIFFVLVSHKDIFQNIFQLIKKHGGEEYSLAEQEKSVDENILLYQQKIDENLSKIKGIHSTLIEIIEVYGKSIKAFYDNIFARFAREKVEQRFVSTQTVKYIVGWILEKDTEQIKKIMSRFNFVEYSIEDPKPDDEPPVELKNNKIIQPYESLTELYSIPKYNEIDPTPLIAPIYPILFGICLGDFGYGVLLFIGSLFLIKKNKTEKLLKVFFQSSIWTIVFGILTGTYFGTRLDLLEKSSPGLFNFINKFIWFDPLSNPMKLLVLALQIGIIQMASSFLIALITQIKSKEYYKAFTQTLAYFLITIAGSLLVSTMFGFNLPSLIKTILTGICALSLLSLLIFSANSEKSAFEKGIGKFFAIYNVAGIMGDILSFSRLLALGLSTSVIAMVANITAQIVRGSKFNPISWILSLIPLVLLHGINFLLGLLGAFVHSMRLQFVEFFKNFYEGGGKKWTPFKRVHKYSIIVKQ